MLWHHCCVAGQECHPAGRWGAAAPTGGTRGLGGCSALTPLSLQTVEHGFPSQPSALAYDPRLRVMAIGTKAGAVKLYPFLTPPPKNKTPRREGTQPPATSWRCPSIRPAGLQLC